MDYQSTLDDITEQSQKIKDLEGHPDFGHDRDLLSYAIDKVILAIGRHYHGDNQQFGAVWMKQLFEIKESGYNNILRHKNATRVIENITEDLNSRLKIANKRKNGNGGNQNKVLEDQLTAINNELDNADKKNARLQRQIDELKSELKKERSQIGMISKYVEDQERQKRNEINDQIKQYQNEQILLETKVNGLKADKARIEDQIKGNNPNTIIHHDDEGKPLTLKGLKEAFDASERTNRATQKTLEETSHLFEECKRKNAELIKAVSNAENLLKKSANDSDEQEKRFDTLSNDLKSSVENTKNYVIQVDQENQKLKSELATRNTEKEMLTEKAERLERELEKEKNKPTVVGAIPTTNNNKYFKPFVTTFFVLAIYIWFSLPKVLDITMDIRLLWGVVIVLVAAFAILILSKKDDYKNNFLILIVGLGLAFFSWLLSLK